MNMFIQWISSSGLMPHGFCYQWKPALILLHAISDSMIAFAYFSIPLVLIYFVRRRRDLPFGWMFVCFGVFITACGATHVMEVWTLWVPSYWLSGGVKVITALASVPTAIFLVRIMPAALSVPGLEVMRNANEELKRQAAALEKSEDRFRQMAENIQEIFWMVDPKTMEATYVNPAFEQICERTLDSLYSNPTSYREIIHPEDRPKVLAALQQLESANKFDEEFRIVCPSGAVKWMRAIGFNAKDSLGGVSALVGTVQEITARKEIEIALRESEDRYRDLVEHSTDLVCTYNLQGRLLSVNELPAKLLGYSREEVLNKPMRDFLLPEARTQFDESLATIKKEGFVKGSMVVLTKTGERRIWDYHNTLRTEGVTVPVVRGIAHDVTDQKRLERALRQSEEKFAKAFHSSPVEILITTLQEDLFLDVNEAFERSSGFARNEAIGRTSVELGIWDDPNERAQVIYQIKDHGSLQDREVRFRTKSGITRIKRYFAEQIEIGGKACLLAVCEDITERKGAEKELVRARERIESVLNSIADAHVLFDRNWRYLYVNEAAIGIIGRLREEILGHTLWDLYPDLLGTEMEGHYRRAMDQRLAVAFDFHYDSSNTWWENRLYPAPEGLALFATDITKRHTAEQVLRKTEQQFSAILNHSPNLIFLKDVEGRYLLINKEYRKTFCFKRDQIYGKKDIELFPPEQAAIFRGSDLQVLHARAPMEFEEVVLRDDGPHVSIVQKFPLFDEKGEIHSICGFVTDITERKRAEERLREYEKTVEGLEEMIVVVDREYRLQLANHAYLNYRGKKREDVVGHLLPDLLDRGAFDRVIKGKLDECFQGKAVHFETRYNYAHLGERDLSISYFPIESPSGVDRAAGVIRDITERKRAEEEMRRLSGQLLQLQDNERRRISRELHDSTGQDLVALSTTLHQLHTSIPTSRRKTRKLTSQCEALAVRCLHEVRTLSYLLYPAMLDETGLEDAIHHFADGFAERTGIEVVSEISPGSERLPPDIELALFRVVQESLTNIQRHSASLTAKIRLDRQDGIVSLEVSDKGRGASGKSAARNGEIPFEVGVGIPSMQERVKLIGGELDIASSHAGTAVRVKVPLNSQKHEKTAYPGG